MSKQLGLSYEARKALAVHVGEEAGTEIANLLDRLSSQIEELKRSKVSVTPVVPGAKPSDEAQLAATLENETF